MFKEILPLLIENFANVEEDGYISFATDAISAIYHVGIAICNLSKFTVYIAQLIKFYV